MLHIQIYTDLIVGSKDLNSNGEYVSGKLDNIAKR